MVKDKTEVGLWRTLGVVQFTASTMSIVSLIGLGFKPGGWSAPAQFLIGLWQRLIDVLFGWAEQPMRMALGWVAALRDLPADLYPYPHWPHYLVLFIFIFVPFDLAWWRDKPTSKPLSSALLFIILMLFFGLSIATIPGPGTFVAMNGQLIFMAFFGPGCVIFGYLSNRASLRLYGWVTISSLVAAGLLVFSSPRLEPLIICEICFPYQLNDLSKWLWF